MLNVGFDNYVNMDMIQAISGNPNAGPIKKLIQVYKTSAQPLLIDFTNGKKAQSVVFLVNKSIVLSAISAETLKKRFVLVHDGKDDTTKDE